MQLLQFTTHQICQSLGQNNENFFMSQLSQYFGGNSTEYKIACKNGFAGIPLSVDCNFAPSGFCSVMSLMKNLDYIFIIKGKFLKFSQKSFLDAGFVVLKFRLQKKQEWIYRHPIGGLRQLSPVWFPL